MLDLNGFLTSTEFLFQLASIVSAIISSLLGTLFSGFLGTA